MDNMGHIVAANAQLSKGVRRIPLVKHLVALLFAVGISFVGVNLVHADENAPEDLDSSTSAVVQQDTTLDEGGDIHPVPQVSETPCFQNEVNLATVPSFPIGEFCYGDGFKYYPATKTFIVTGGSEVSPVVATGTEGSPSGVRIEIAEGETAWLKIENLQIDLEQSQVEAAPISVGAGATLNLVLAGENSLRGYALNDGVAAAGIFAPTGTSLNISGSGSLDATGGNYSAGIGGADGYFGPSVANSGNINISGGVVRATGGAGAAGIGGGWDGSAGNITIGGGIVIATGGNSSTDAATGSGIGGGMRGNGGNGGNGGNVSITAGVVIANAGDDSLYSDCNLSNGIGGNADGYCTASAQGTLNISGNAAVFADEIGPTGGNFSFTSGLLKSGAVATAKGTFTLPQELFTQVVLNAIYSDEYNGLGDGYFPFKGFDFVIASGANVTSPSEVFYGAAPDQTITINGKLTNHGYIYLESSVINVNGTLVNNQIVVSEGGVINVYGTLTNNGTINNNDLQESSAHIYLKCSGTYTGNAPYGNPVEQEGGCAPPAPRCTGWICEHRFALNGNHNFKDLGNTSAEFKNHIKWLYQHKVTSGVNATTYAPKANVTREQMAKFLYALANNNTGFTPPSRGTFADVSPSSQFRHHIEWLKAKGITSGVTPTQYNPKGNVTREQMAAFMYRLAGNPAQSATQCGFKDVDKKSQFAKAICWMKAKGITSGTSPTTYAPKNNVTREQMSKFMQKLYEWSMR
jgi:hypothetical protein